MIRNYVSYIPSILNIPRLCLRCMIPSFTDFSKKFASFTKSHYSILGLKPDATDEEIKKAYYSLSKKYHPDLNVGDKHAEAKILEINAAFEILGNKVEKEKYDSKMFPKVWESCSYIYDHSEETKTPPITYRREFKHLSYGCNQFYKHLKGEMKRKYRHDVSKCMFRKSQSSMKLSKVYFKRN